MILLILDCSLVCFFSRIIPAIAGPVGNNALGHHWKLHLGLQKPTCATARAPIKAVKREVATIGPCTRGSIADNTKKG